MDTVTINRAPVLTLWAAVVAERLGFERDEALTLGKAVAGLTAQSKGQRLGIFTPSPESVRRQRAEKAKEAGVFPVALMGRAVPVLHTDEGLRAVGKDQKPVEPASVEKYLKSKFLVSPACRSRGDDGAREIAIARGARGGSVPAVRSVPAWGSGGGIRVGGEGDAESREDRCAGRQAGKVEVGWWGCLECQP